MGPQYIIVEMLKMTSLVKDIQNKILANGPEMLKQADVILYAGDTAFDDEMLLYEKGVTRFSQLFFSYHFITIFHTDTNKIFVSSKNFDRKDFKSYILK